MKRLILIVALAGCTQAAPQIPEGATDTCNAARYADLIGQDATALERVLILGQVRVIRPGDAVTKDYRLDRINFHIAADARITAINCG